MFTLSTLTEVEKAKIATQAQAKNSYATQAIDFIKSEALKQDNKGKELKLPLDASKLSKSKNVNFFRYRLSGKNAQVVEVVNPILTNEGNLAGLAITFKK